MPKDTFDPATVALMRGDVARLGDSDEHALRLTLRLAGAMDRMLTQLAVTMGLRRSEVSALMALWDGGRCSASELSKRIGLSRAAMTTMLDRLERAELVTRDPDPEDRRQVLLMPSPRFEQLLEMACDDHLRGTLQGLAATDPESWQGFATVASRVRGDVLEATTEMRQAKHLNVHGRAARRRTATSANYW